VDINPKIGSGFLRIFGLLRASSKKRQGNRCFGKSVNFRAFGVKIYWINAHKPGDLKSLDLFLAVPRASLHSILWRDNFY